MGKHLGFVAMAFAVPLLSMNAMAQQPTTGSASASAPVTVTGCIERADQVMTRKSGDDVDSLDFMLIKVQKDGDSDTPTGTSGHASAPGKPEVFGVGTMYRLRGTTDQINPHVGHQVEITGTVMPVGVNAGGNASGTAATAGSAPAASAGAAGSSSGAATAPVAASRAEQAPVLSITQMKLVSETCPRSAR